MNLALIILAFMVFYDFSLHLLELILGKDKAEKLRYYWPSFKVRGKESRKLYTLFWTTYWGIALVLVIYLINKF